MCELNCLKKTTFLAGCILLFSILAISAEGLETKQEEPLHENLSFSGQIVTLENLFLPHYHVHQIEKNPHYLQKSRKDLSTGYPLLVKALNKEKQRLQEKYKDPMVTDKQAIENEALELVNIWFQGVFCPVIIMASGEMD